jgi:hypothetical protein
MIDLQRRQVLRSLILSVALAATALLPSGATAQEETVPTRVRVLKATRGTPQKLDPRLEDVKKQISALAWQRWELVTDQTMALAQGSSSFVDLPDGSHAALSVVEVRGKLVTVEVSMAQKNTQTRVTIERGQRIVHQVAKEKKGLALFIVVTPWP